MLAISDLEVRYGGIRALSGVSLSVEEGQVVGIVGANGAGKSTLLNCVAGLLRVAQGTITFRGERIDRFRAHQVVRRGISLVPEGRRVFPGMTAHHNLVLAARASGRGRTDDIDQVLDLFPQLRGHLHQLAGTLSGGEQQMLAVGRALVTRPSLLLLDEPSMGLAPFLVELLFEKLAEIRDLGTTLCVVEQNVQGALKIADYIYVMRNGAISAEGLPEELSEREHLVDLYLGRS